jgi:hypothetical protein
MHFAALRSVLPLACTFAVAACTSVWPTLTGTSPQPVPGTVDCVAQEAKTRGYDVRVVNHHGGVEATKEDTSSQMYVNELRRYDQLSATVTPATAASSSHLEIKAGTISYYETRRGRTPTDEPASAAVQNDAREILSKCGGQ